MFLIVYTFIKKGGMGTISHPKEILREKEADTIRRNTFATEKNGRLHEEVLSLIYKNKLLQLLVPKFCGGLEWDLPNVVTLLEALAWADGNVGWCVNLGAGANMFAGYFSKNTAQSIFNSSQIWCAGSGAISGTAKKTSDGYIVSGYWKYASGSVHATHFTANAWLFNETNQYIRENGERVFRSFIVPKENVTILDTWNVTGLKATSSNDFKVKEILVPEDHAFSLIKPLPFAKGPLYHFPFDVLAIVNMACMPTGIALHFIDLFRELLQQKKPLYTDMTLDKNEAVMSLLEETTNRFYIARRKMYETLEKAWVSYEKGNKADQHALDQLVQRSKAAAQMARNVIFKLYPSCGMNIIFSNSELNKVWRDMAVASQHYLLSPLG
jgi:alkylation response protein AidB-like acyl-CoA dehydrogenase